MATTNREGVKVYSYIRVSTSIQVDGYSLDAQRQAIQNYANYEKMHIVREYADEGFSGKNIAGREQFQEMLEDIQSDRDGVKFVLVFKLSRFGRNAADTLFSLQTMQDFGVNLISVDDKLDSSTDVGKVMISIMSSMAEMERDNIHAQTMAGRRQKARMGGWNGGFAPYGYKLINGHLTVEEEEAKVVRMIFDLFVNTTLGANGVAKKLNDDGSKFNLDHDNRKHSSPNINPEKTPENISYAGNISLQKFYEETFQKAYEEYIQKQIKGGHGNRVKNAPKTYYESVVQKQAEAEAELQKAIQGGKHGDELTRLDSYTRVAKQIIVQIGNTDDLEAMSPKERNETRDKMKEALQEYMETFQSENPNLRIVNAVIHMDEISLSPHLHLTYVPVVEQKRGQAVANSQSGALKAMGFESDKKADENGEFQTGQMKWQTRERERVIEIADKFGLSVGYQRGNRGKGLTIEDYRVAKQKEREALMSQEAIEKRKSELAEVQSELNRTTVEFNALSEDLYDTVAALSDSKSELRETEQEIIEKTEELNHLSEQVDQIPDVLNQSVDLCEQEMKAKLIPPVSPSDNYERTTKGVLSSKKTYVMVPEKDYEVLERRNGLKPQAVQGIIKEALQPLRDAIVQLPVVKNLIATIQRLEHEVGEWRKRCRKAEREKEALQKENAELKAEKAVADRVMQTKLNLSPQVIDIMKSQAAQELAREQRDKDDDVLGF